MVILKLDQGSHEPLYGQILKQIIFLIENGTLTAGTHLPSSRALAEKLGVNRSTVYRAYQELWALGYTESRPGSYSTIRQRAESAAVKGRKLSACLPWGELSTPPSRVIYDDYVRLSNKYPELEPSDVIALTDLSADVELCPVEDFRKCVREVLLRKGRDILQYGEPAGYRPLRETIAHHMQVHGVSVRPEEILITHGAQHGIELVLKFLTVPGSRVAVEAPTYGLGLPLFRFFGIDLMGIPMRDDGLDLHVLEKKMRRERPAFLYTIPNFHNPTGITTSHVHRESLLGLCESYGVPVVEDGFEEEMKYFGKAVLPIKSMDACGIVVYLGTFSKVVFPGLRIGWVAADEECIRRLTSIKRFCSLSSSNLGQAALDRFCRMGFYEHHIKRIHSAYRKRMKTALKAVKDRFPRRGVLWTEPLGGYTLWVRLPGVKCRETVFQEILIKHGVVVSPGSYYFPQPGRGLQFRLSICNLREPEIQEGIRRLGRALREVLTRTSLRKGRGKRM